MKLEDLIINELFPYKGTHYYDVYKEALEEEFGKSKVNKLIKTLSKK